MKNLEIAQMFYEIADLLEIKGVSFKPRAYRRAAQHIETLPEDIREIYERDELKLIPGVGASIEAKIQEILETGGLEYLEELREEMPGGLRELVEIEGIGPKTALALHKILKITSIDELASAAKSGKLRGLRGFGRKVEENILRGIEIHRSAQKRFLLGYILPMVLEVRDELARLEVVKRISLAGSVRRRKETVGDADILVASEQPRKVMDFFVSMPLVKDVLAKGKTKSSVRLTNGLQVDVRVVNRDNFGSALQYFTGSKEHNIKLRGIALKRGWKLSEYGLFEKDTNRKIAGRSEGSIYQALGLCYVEPELRENRGEIEAAMKGSLPKLIGYGEVKGDLHVHSKWSDGSHSIEEMIAAARALGQEYLGICDHSKTMRIAHGLKEEDLSKQVKHIQKLNEKIEDFTVLSGIEVDIKSDGKLDLNDEALKDLDIVVASIHSGFKQPREKMTERILTAIHNDHVNVLGHPTGRIIHKRPPYQIDLPTVLEAAQEQKVFMEINAFPNRLDLHEINCQTAKDYGLKMSIGTDAHSRDQLRYINLGIATARRGWLEPKDVINTLSVDELKELLRK